MSQIEDKRGRPRAIRLETCPSSLQGYPDKSVEYLLYLSEWEYGKPQLYGSAVDTVQEPEPRDSVSSAKSHHQRHKHGYDCALCKRFPLWLVNPGHQLLLETGLKSSTSTRTE